MYYIGKNVTAVKSGTASLKAVKKYIGQPLIFFYGMHFEPREWLTSEIKNIPLKNGLGGSFPPPLFSAQFWIRDIR